MDFMKKFKKLICTSFAITLIFSSCATKPANQDEDIKNTGDIIETENPSASEKIQDSTLTTDEQTESDTDSTSDYYMDDDGVEFIDEEVVEVKTPEDLFIESIENLNISFTKAASETRKTKAFKDGYEILVTDEMQNPVADCPVTLKYPVDKDGSTLVFETITLTTDENGKIAFTCPTPSFAANSEVTAYPAIPSDVDSSAVLDYAMAKSNTAIYKSKSDVTDKGALLFIYEYNENGKVGSNSYTILSALRNKGVWNAGNAPVSDTSNINASKEKIYKDNYEFVGTDFGYLIGGTIKFVRPVTNIDGEYVAEMTADLYGINMKSGKVIFELKKDYSGSGSNWTKAVNDCKDKLSKAVTDELLYGL